MRISWGFCIQGFRIKIIVFPKNGAKEQNIIRKGSDCAAAKAANISLFVISFFL
jgi:hypothetical protein